MQQVKVLGAREERRYGVEWGEKQCHSLTACLPFRLRGQGGGGCKSENPYIKKLGGKEVKMCEKTWRIKVMITKDSRTGPREREESRRVNQRMQARPRREDRLLRIGSPGYFTNLSLTALWALASFLPSNSFSGLPPSVTVYSPDSQCRLLSKYWQSIHHTLK